MGSSFALFANFMFFGSFIFAYLLGSISFSVIFSKKFGTRKDIRSLGSNNAGFSNVLRSVGICPAVLTFICDFLKGMIPILICKYYICTRDNLNIFHFIDDSFFSPKFLYSWLTLVGFFCCLGHIWPIFFKFKGGKGILSTWAFTLFIDWRIFLSLIVIFLIVLLLSRIISLSSIIAAISYPISVFLFTKYIIPTLISAILSLIIIYKHKSNIIRIFNGNERKI